MNVGDWLRKLGLERYEAAFRGNNVTGEILPKLTAEDLKDLGVVLVGDRRLQLDAIGCLRSEAGPPSANLPDIGERPSGDHFTGTYVPVREPSTASEAELYLIRAHFRQCSIRQPRAAQTVKSVLEVVGVLVPRTAREGTKRQERSLLNRFGHMRASIR